MYTSGSTGRPKGVLVEAGSLSGLVYEMSTLIGVAPGDRMLAATTVTFDISLVELLVPLVAGMECVIADNDTARDPVLLAGLAADAAVTIVQATPSVWDVLADHLRGPLRVAVTGGEALPAAVRDRILGCAERVYNVYGPT